jgi:hypothetical protein
MFVQGEEEEFKKFIRYTIVHFFSKGATLNPKHKFKV